MLLYSLERKKMTPEKIKHHISHLQEKHRQLDYQISTMVETGKFEDLDIEHLKKERLAIQDEIQENQEKLKNIS